jgi:hypothetical protein
MDTYRKPIYDPFEVFKPSKSFLKEVIKQLNQQCYALQDDKIKINQNPDCPAWLAESICEDIDKLLRPILNRIKHYQSFIRYGLQGCGQDNGRFSEADIERARQYPITDLYQGQLRKTGARYLGTCPFHEEKTPSFVIYANNTWHCFGACGEGGDSIDFLMKSKGIKFPEAVKLLL